LKQIACLAKLEGSLASFKVNRQSNANQYKRKSGEQVCWRGAVDTGSNHRVSAARDIGKSVHCLLQISDPIGFTAPAGGPNNPLSGSRQSVEPIAVLANPLVPADTLIPVARLRQA
jgi:hypothetical protein